MIVTVAGGYALISDSVESLESVGPNLLPCGGEGTDAHPILDRGG